MCVNHVQNNSCLLSYITLSSGTLAVPGHQITMYTKFDKVKPNLFPGNWEILFNWTLVFCFNFSGISWPNKFTFSTNMHNTYIYQTGMTFLCNPLVLTVYLTWNNWLSNPPWSWKRSKTNIRRSPLLCTSLEACSVSRSLRESCCVMTGLSDNS